MQFRCRHVGYACEPAACEGAERVEVAALIALIAGSPIVVSGHSAGRVVARRDLPAGFDAIDIATLDWIAAESRRADRRPWRM